MIFGLSAPEDDIGEIRSDHRQRRSAASASRKFGAAFLGYQGRAIQVTVVPYVGMYQVQMAALSHSESDAALSGPFLPALGAFRVQTESLVRRDDAQSA